MQSAGWLFKSKDFCWVRWELNCGTWELIWHSNAMFLILFTEKVLSDIYHDYNIELYLWTEIRLCCIQVFDDNSRHADYVFHTERLCRRKLRAHIITLNAQIVWKFCTQTTSYYWNLNKAESRSVPLNPADLCHAVGMKMWKYSRWQHSQNVMFPGTCFRGLTLVSLYLPLTTGPLVGAGAHGGRVGWGTVLQARKSWVRFPMVSLEFFIAIILPAAVWHCGWLNL